MQKPREMKSDRKSQFYLNFARQQISVCFQKEKTPLVNKIRNGGIVLQENEKRGKSGFEY